MTRLVVLNYPATTATPSEIVTSGSFPALVSLPLNVTTYSENGAYVIPNFQRLLGFYSASDLSGITFSISGYNVYGQLISETGLVGPNAGIIYSTKQYYKILSIIPSAAIVTPAVLSIGYGTTGTSVLVSPYILPNYCPISAASLVAGTIVYSVNVTLDQINPPSGSAIPYVPTMFPFATAFNGASANQLVSITGPVTAVQVIMTTNNTPTTGSLVVTLCQQGSGS